MENSFCERYEEGRLLVGMKSGSMERSFRLFNGFDFQIDEVSGNRYESSLPGDSIDYVIDYLNSKEYINTKGFGAVKDGSVYLNYQTKVLTIGCTLWGMTLENQRDWIETTSILKLTDTSDIRYFVLTIPVGEEIKWATTFKTFNSVRWAEPNCYAQIVLD
jgi:hypothetical protein